TPGNPQQTPTPPPTQLAPEPQTIQRRERVDRTGHLATTRHSFAVWFGFRRFRNYARPVGPKKLHLQSSSADAFRTDDRRGKSPFAGAVATVKCDSTRRQRRYAGPTNSNASTIWPKYATGGRRTTRVGGDIAHGDGRSGP